MKKSKKAVIFDFDGVIHDTLEIWYNIQKTKEPGLTLKTYKDKFNGNVYENKNLEKYETHVEKYMEMADKNISPLKIEREIKKEILEIKKKYDLYIISSNHEHVLNNYFENNKILHIFDEVYGFETHRSKYEKFLILLKKYNLAPDECIFVTDTLGDILEANKVGIETIAVDYGFHERTRLLKGNPKFIVSDFKEIAKLVKNCGS